MGERTSESPGVRPLSWSLRTIFARRALARRSSSPASNHASYSGRDSSAIRDASSCSLRPSSSSRLISAASAGWRSPAPTASIPDAHAPNALTSASPGASRLCTRDNATPQWHDDGEGPHPNRTFLGALYPGPAPRLLRGEGPHVNPGLTTPPRIGALNLTRNRVKSRLSAGESPQNRRCAGVLRGRLLGFACRVSPSPTRRIPAAPRRAAAP